MAKIKPEVRALKKKIGGVVEGWGSLDEASFGQKLSLTEMVLEEAVDLWRPKIGLAWSTGKDSTVLLFLVRKIYPEIPVLFGDTTQHFPETYDYRDKMAKLWDLNLTNAVPRKSYAEVKGKREKCCSALKTEPALEAIGKLGLEACIVGIRWDEHPARSEEKFVSRREKRVVFPHWRIHPVLHWKEAEVWEFLKREKIPLNPLYQKGFRSIGCQPCTVPAPAGGGERSGRDQDKEEVMKRLRALNYW